jgi:integrase
MKTKLGQTIEQPIIQKGRKQMDSLINDTTQHNRMDCPFQLNPQTATFSDIAIHALLRQRLKSSTIDKHLRYARFMETHIVPVDFRTPNFKNFIDHMDYREQIEKATPNALIHQWKAMQIFLKAYGIRFGEGTEWNYRPPSPQLPRKRILPLPETVNQFFHHIYSEDSYENALYQYLFFHSFMIGWRVPSEIITMTVSNIRIDSPIPHIVIIEPKKHNKTRLLYNIEPAILTSSIHKSFKNWIEHWRPKVANQYSGDKLYLQPDGKPFTTRHLGHNISKHGKQIWKDFRPYDMRHWCAVARLIKTKVETKNFDIFQVQKWLGHEESSTTHIYVSQATDYYNHLPVDWISLALKPSQMAGKRDQEKNNRMHFLSLLSGISSREESGPAEI